MLDLRPPFEAAPVSGVLEYRRATGHPDHYVDHDFTWFDSRDAAGGYTAYLQALGYTTEFHIASSPGSFAAGRTDVRGEDIGVSPRLARARREAARGVAHGESARAGAAREAAPVRAAPVRAAREVAPRRIRITWSHRNSHGSPRAEDDEEGYWVAESSAVDQDDYEIPPDGPPVGEVARPLVGHVPRVMYGAHPGRYVADEGHPGIYVLMPEGGDIPMPDGLPEE